MQERDEKGIAGRGGLAAFDMDDEDYERTERYTVHMTFIVEEIQKHLDRLHEKYPKQFPQVLANADLAIKGCAANVARADAHICDFLKGRNHRILYAEAIHTAFDIFEQCFIAQAKHVVAYGGTNLGKTSASHVLRLIAGPLYHFMSQHRICILNIYIDRNAVEDQANQSFESMLSLYGGVELKLVEPPTKGGRTTWTLARYHQIVLEEIAGGPTANKQNRLNLTRSKKDIETIAKKAKALGWDVMSIIDEIHHAPKLQGRLGGKMNQLDPFLDEPEEAVIVDDEEEEEEEDEDLLKERKKWENDRSHEQAMMQTIAKSTKYVVGFSATPETTLEALWVRVKMRYSPIYASTHPWYRGERIADKQIPVLGFSDFYLRSGIDLRFVNPRQLSKNRTPQYVSKCYNAIAKALFWCVKDKIKGHKGAFVRLERTNDNAKKFAKFLRKAGFKTVEYLDDNIGENIQDQLIDLKNGEAPFVVIATAGMRMSDDLPKEVCSFFDFTIRSAFRSSIRQGTCGRASGHFKDSFVVMSDVNAKAVKDDNYDNEYGSPKKNANQHTTLERSDLDRMQQRLDITAQTPQVILDALRPIYAHLVAEATKVCEGVRPTKVDDLDGQILASRKGEAIDLAPIFTDEVIDAIEDGMVRQHGTFKRIHLLRFNGDEMPESQIFDKGIGSPLFMEPHYAFRDRSKVDRGTKNKIKVWRGNGGFQVQVLWTFNDNGVDIAALVWPVKGLVAKETTVPQAKAGTWQNAVKREADKPGNEDDGNDGDPAKNGESV